MVHGPGSPGVILRCRNIWNIFIGRLCSLSVMQSSWHKSLLSSYELTARLASFIFNPDHIQHSSWATGWHVDFLFTSMSCLPKKAVDVCPVSLSLSPSYASTGTKYFSVRLKSKNPVWRSLCFVFCLYYNLLRGLYLNHCQSLVVVVPTRGLTTPCTCHPHPQSPPPTTQQKFSLCFFWKWLLALFRSA